MDVIDLIKDKEGVLKFLLGTIKSSEKNASGVRSMKQRGFSENGMLEKVIEIVAIQSIQIKALAIIAMTYAQSNTMTNDAAQMANKMGRGTEAMQAIFDVKFKGK